MRNLELPGRSPVHGSEGMACVSQPLAAQTAIDVLKAGGNAMDGAVAACAVQCAAELTIAGCHHSAGRPALSVGLMTAPDSVTSAPTGQIG